MTKLLMLGSIINSVRCFAFKASFYTQIAEIYTGFK